jgi:CheY-like chemotaxis protein
MAGEASSPLPYHYDIIRRAQKVKRILVVEDNETNLYLIRFILNKSGYEVIEAMEGQTGVELAAKEKPDLILMDIQLPDIDGLEATKAIRKFETDDMQPQSSIVNRQSSIHRVPIIALTSYAMVGDKEKAMAAGCTGYIEKPINPDTFIAEMEKYL